jgi:hypothetical protein
MGVTFSAFESGVDERDDTLKKGRKVFQIKVCGDVLCGNSGAGLFPGHEQPFPSLRPRVLPCYPQRDRRVGAADFQRFCAVEENALPVLRVPGAAQLDTDERLAVFGDWMQVDAMNSDEILDLLRKADFRQDFLPLLFSENGFELLADAGVFVKVRIAVIKSTGR